jgi:SAM-dependent methyltransferase
LNGSNTLISAGRNGELYHVKPDQLTGRKLGEGATVASEASAYDVYSRSYDALYRKEQEAKLKAALRVGWSTGDRLVDFGCGTALLTNSLARGCDMVVGLDVSEGMLERAKRRTRVDLVLADAAFVPFRNSAFTAGCCFTSFHNFRMKKKAIDGMVASVHEGGSMLFSLLARGRSSKDERQVTSERGLEVRVKVQVGNDLLVIARRL